VSPAADGQALDKAIGRPGAWLAAGHSRLTPAVPRHPCAHRAAVLAGQRGREPSAAGGRVGAPRPDAWL